MSIESKDRGVPCFSLRDISKAFEDNTVLDAVSLDIWPGESLVIIGQSGAGKSVLLKCLLGLMKPDSGTILANGIPLSNETARHQRKRFEDVGVLFQSSALFDSLTIWENVAFCFLHTLSRRKARDLAEEYLSMVGLSCDVLDLYPHELSGGMQRRAALARAIARRPKILFFDEPTAGLDPVFSSHISELIRTCLSKINATAITITHDIRCAQIIGDSIAMLCNGKLIWQGRAENLLETQNPWVDQFIQGQTCGPIQISLA